MGVLLGLTDFYLQNAESNIPDSLRKSADEISIDYDFCIPNIKELKSVINGNKKQVRSRDYHNFKFTIIDPDIADFETLINLLLAGECLFQPHFEDSANEFYVNIVKLQPKYVKGNFSIDSLEVELESTFETNSDTEFEPIKLYKNLMCEIYPEDSSINIPISTKIYYFFNKIIDISTIETNISDPDVNMYLSKGATKTATTFAQTNDTDFVLTPDALLDYDTFYTATAGSTIHSPNASQDGSWAGKTVTFKTKSKPNMPIIIKVQIDNTIEIIGSGTGLLYYTYLKNSLPADPDNNSLLYSEPLPYVDGYFQAVEFGGIDYSEICTKYFNPAPIIERQLQNIAMSCTTHNSQIAETHLPVIWWNKNSLDDPTDASNMYDMPFPLVSGRYKAVVKHDGDYSDITIKDFLADFCVFTGPGNNDTNVPVDTDISFEFNREAVGIVTDITDPDVSLFIYIGSNKIDCFVTHTTGTNIWALKSNGNLPYNTVVHMVVTTGVQPADGENINWNGIDWSFTTVENGNPTTGWIMYVSTNQV